MSKEMIESGLPGAERETEEEADEIVVNGEFVRVLQDDDVARFEVGPLPVVLE